MKLSILIISLLILSFILIRSRNQKKGNQRNNNPHLELKDLVKNTFPKYKVIEKHKTIMICEINHRNEPDELVFIRINPNQRKNIKKSGRMLICDYPKKPTSKEMLSDFRGHL